MKCRINPDKKVQSLGQIVYDVTICHLAKNRGLPWWRHILSSSILFPSNSKSVQTSLFSLCLQAIGKDFQKNNHHGKKSYSLHGHAPEVNREFCSLYLGSHWEHVVIVYIHARGWSWTQLQKTAIPWQGKWTECLLLLGSQEQKLGVFLFIFLF